MTDIITNWFDRAATCTGELFWLLDKYLLFLIKAFFFVWLNRGHAPTLDYTVSAYVGLHASLGERWALIAAKVIGWLMLNPKHCFQAYEREYASG